MGAKKKKRKWGDNEENQAQNGDSGADGDAEEMGDEATGDAESDADGKERHDAGPSGSELKKEDSRTMTNEQLIALVKEKIQEKNEVITEQQLQIQELQEKITTLEEEIAQMKKAAAEREDLVSKLSEILE